MPDRPRLALAAHAIPGPVNIDRQAPVEIDRADGRSFELAVEPDLSMGENRVVPRQIL